MIESSSVWEEVYNYMRNELDLNVVLLDSYKTRLIRSYAQLRPKRSDHLLPEFFGYLHRIDRF